LQGHLKSSSINGGGGGSVDLIAAALASCAKPPGTAELLLSSFLFPVLSPGLRRAPSSRTPGERVAVSFQLSLAQRSTEN
jgi:hypothetical protein